MLFDFEKPLNFTSTALVGITAETKYKRIKSLFKTYRTHYSVKKVFRDMESHSSLSILLGEDDKLLYIKARVISSEGVIKELTDDDLMLMSIKNKGTDAELNNMALIFPNLKENSIIEYTYKIVTEGFVGKNHWYLQEYDAYILRSEISVIGSKNLIYNKAFVYDNVNFCFRWDTRNLERIGSKYPIVDGTKYKSIAKWVFKDVPPFKSESMMPPHNYFLPRIDFSTVLIESWKDLASFYYITYIKRIIKPNNTIKDIASKLVEECKTELDTLEKLTKYVQNIRYESIPLGDRNIRPEKPEKVIENSYGDCKDKSILLISLLNAVRIEAYPALLKTANAGYFPKDFPSWDFNHMIVYSRLSDSSDIWIDPTVRYCSIAELPWQDENLPALVIEDENLSYFATTSASKISDNQSSIDILVNINDSLIADYYVKFSFEGEYGLEMRNLISDLDEDKINKALRGLMKSEFVSDGITDIILSKPSDTDNPFNVSFKFRKNNIITQQGNINILNIDPYDIIGDLFWITEKERKYPIDFEYPYLLKKSIEINYPKNMILKEIPNNIVLNIDDLAYNKNYLSDGQNKIFCNESFGVLKSKIFEGRYNAIKEFYTTIQNKINEKIIFEN